MYAEISQELGYPKSTIYGWLKNLRLSQTEQIIVAERFKDSKRRRMKQLITAKQTKINFRRLELHKEVTELLNNIKLSHGHKQLICSIFFWCEGGKDTSSGFQFINSDPVMIKTFLKLFRDSFSVDESKFRALLHLHDYHDPAHQQQFWSEVTGIPINQFHKPYLKPHTGKNKRDGYPGCLSIRYLDRQFGLRLQMLYTSFGDKYRGIV